MLENNSDYPPLPTGSNTHWHYYWWHSVTFKWHSCVFFKISHVWH